MDKSSNNTLHSFYKSRYGYKTFQEKITVRFKKNNLKKLSVIGGQTN
jgi:uncharacterized membrane protein YfhO